MAMSSRIVGIAGLAIAGAGLAHFVKPDAFEELTAVAFPENTQQHLYMDGAAETVLGLGLALRKTRKLALIGLLGYGGYLAANMLKNRTA
jgi:uncharacterized membrane protein